MQEGLVSMSDGVANTDWIGGHPSLAYERQYFPWFIGCASIHMGRRVVAFLGGSGAFFLAGFEDLAVGVKSLCSLIFGNLLHMLGFGMMLARSLRRRQHCPI